MEKDIVSDVTAVLVSFLRPGYTKACVESLRLTYPAIKIIVGDNGGSFNNDLATYCTALDAEYFLLPFDSGVCVGRNAIVERVKTKYVMIGDDDFFHDTDSMIDSMARFLNTHEEYNIIGGRIYQDGTIRNYQGRIFKYSDHFRTIPIDLQREPMMICDETGLRYCTADLVFNFFLGRTDVIREMKWDENIKVAYEHFTYFYDFKISKYGGTVAFSPDPVVLHKPDFVDSEQSSEYAAYRNRKSDMDYFYKKYRVDYTIDINDRVTKAPGKETVAVYSEVRRQNPVKDVDFCITTFLRPEAVERLVFSITRYYPLASITIADQNFKFDRQFYRELREKARKLGLSESIDVIRLPYDCGVSFARNYLMHNTTKKYKLILDDDFEFTGQTDIKKMIEIMESDPQNYIVGGCVKQLGTELHYEFNLKNENGTIEQMPDGDNWRHHNGIRYKRTGCVLNFALMKSELFAYISWDESLKVTEHTDFYLRMLKNTGKIVYVPEVVVNHPPAERNEEYKAMRTRDEFLVRMLRKHNATKLVYLSGSTLELMPNGTISHYKINKK